MGCVQFRWLIHRWDKIGVRQLWCYAPNIPKMQCNAHHNAKTRECFPRECSICGGSWAGINSSDMSNASVSLAALEEGYYKSALFRTLSHWTDRTEQTTSIDKHATIFMCKCVTICDTIYAISYHICDMRYMWYVTRKYNQCSYIYRRSVRCSNICGYSCRCICIRWTTKIICFTQFNAQLHNYNAPFERGTSAHCAHLAGTD